jgi:hypothetical protein
MTEEQALAVFRKLDPLDAALRRQHLLGANDPYDYVVVVDAAPLSAEDIIGLIRAANAGGLEAVVDSERGDPIFVIDTPEPPVVPAVVPK